MQKKEIRIDDKVYTIRELLAREVDNIDFKDQAKARKIQIQLSTGMSDSDYDDLTFKQRIFLLKETNKINGIDDKPDFQTPTTDSKTN